MGIPTSPTGWDPLDMRLKHHPGHQESSAVEVSSSLACAPFSKDTDGRERAVSSPCWPNNH